MKMLKSDYEVTKYFKMACYKALKKKYAMPFDEKFYSSLNLKLKDKTVGEILKEDETIGCCYFYALITAKALEGCELVVGNLENLNVNLGYCWDNFKHSWVEKDDYVFDTTAKCIFDKEFYYKIFDVKIKNKYKNNDLKNKDLFIKLGLNSIKNREFLKDKLFLFEDFSAVKQGKLSENLIENINDDFKFISQNNLEK